MVANQPRLGVAQLENGLKSGFERLAQLENGPKSGSEKHTKRWVGP
jgi:hypothetical protein